HALGVFETLASKIVFGENVAQTYQFVVTGNAELGFVALSQVVDADKGSRWLVPTDLYTPIRQDAVLLEGAFGKPAARAFLQFLRGDAGREIVARFGYGTD
ncbi:MAG TPA: molybdate ABC transporter substrate-binding protein, partial [Hyphomicrobiales bacterium]|nr:molybdate ABC transporter substrate-binding protein [Hyphomicrobiales bacterium]